MALINCPECNNEVSDTAKVCMKCGYSIEAIVRQLNAHTNKQDSKYLNSSQIKEDINDLKDASKLLLVALFLLTIGIPIFVGIKNSSFFALFATFIFLLALFAIYAFYKISVQNSSAKRIIDELGKVYPVFGQNDNVSNYSVIESNVYITGEKPEHTIARMYVKAFQLKADAILSSEMTSRTRLVRAGNASIKKELFSNNYNIKQEKAVEVTTHSLTASYLKFKG